MPAAVAATDERRQQHGSTSHPGVDPARRADPHRGQRANRKPNRVDHDASSGVDETTSTLPPRESKWFVETLRAATTDGTCVLMVSHKLSELLSAAQRVVLLIDGSVVADRPVSPHYGRPVLSIAGVNSDPITLNPYSEPGQIDT